MLPPGRVLPKARTHQMREEAGPSVVRRPSAIPGRSPTAPRTGGAAGPVQTPPGASAAKPGVFAATPAHGCGRAAGGAARTFTRLSPAEESLLTLPCRLPVPLSLCPYQPSERQVFLGRRGLYLPRGDAVVQPFVLQKAQGGTVGSQGAELGGSSRLEQSPSGPCSACLVPPQS